MFQGKGHDHTLDIWSLGVILYEMIVGRPPFQSTNNALLIQKVLAKELRFPAFVPKGVCDLVQRLLQGEPRERLPLDGVLQHPWVLQPDFDGAADADDTVLEATAKSWPEPGLQQFSCRDLQASLANGQLGLDHHAAAGAPEGLAGSESQHSQPRPMASHPSAARSWPEPGLQQSSRRYPQALLANGELGLAHHAIADAPEGLAGSESQHSQLRSMVSHPSAAPQLGCRTKASFSPAALTCRSAATSSRVHSRSGLVPASRKPQAPQTPVQHYRWIASAHAPCTSSSAAVASPVQPLSPLQRRPRSTGPSLPAQRQLIMRQQQRQPQPPTEQQQLEFRSQPTAQQLQMQSLMRTRDSAVIGVRSLAGSAAISGPSTARRAEAIPTPLATPMQRHRVVVPRMASAGFGGYTTSGYPVMAPGPPKPYSGSGRVPSPAARSGTPLAGTPAVGTAPPQVASPAPYAPARSGPGLARVISGISVLGPGLVHQDPWEAARRKQLWGLALR